MLTRPLLVLAALFLSVAAGATEPSDVANMIINETRSDTCNLVAVLRDLSKQYKLAGPIASLIPSNFTGMALLPTDAAFLKILGTAYEATGVRAPTALPPDDDIATLLKTPRLQDVLKLHILADTTASNAFVDNEVVPVVQKSTTELILQNLNSTKTIVTTTIDTLPAVNSTTLLTPSDRNFCSKEPPSTSISMKITVPLALNLTAFRQNTSDSSSYLSFNLSATATSSVSKAVGLETYVLGDDSCNNSITIIDTVLRPCPSDVASITEWLFNMSATPSPPASNLTSRQANTSTGSPPAGNSGLQLGQPIGGLGTLFVTGLMAVVAGALVV